MIFSFLLIACSGFSYKYYGMKDVSYEQGVLLGPNEKDDLPFSKCTPNTQTQYPCVVLFAKDFFAMKQDYEDTKNRLSACEKIVGKK